ncbi:hypothetical protein IMCGPPIG_00530 [Stenotrophomonas maltophilia]|uniref:hypothetical protein n=1 Tax=Stenotrophomonas TaxID=40323 RepID=UPI00066C19A2|nr:MULTISPECIES: hypothetical protein [unclassified Stenotrophomonas]MBA0254424.1 hypothetical protein [Stenotrophomonas maltophilia]MBA0479803.1 hypothetical protein [Stenotrophomonas maltophilia]MBA0488027.1 hypothetical protein [Stenotrophomonas maltophilia]MBA0492088.1 hypothetical protein [Stenotrophomonas maltophilia]MDG9763122.1 hypothetical protein [Stenotrophomonas sp. GD04064]
MTLVPVVYRSSDPGAPVLNGQAGSLLALLNAILVTGYGDGASSKPGAGWTRPYASSSVQVFRNSATTGSGTYLRVRDDASAATLNTGCVAQLLAYSSMSDIDNGADQTPSAVLQARGSFIAKAPTTAPDARSWMAIATEIGFYLFTAWSNFGNGLGPYYFGDLDTAVSGDVFPFAMFGSNDLTFYTPAWNADVCSLFFASTLGTAVDGVTGRDRSYVPGGFVMRSYSGGQNAPGRIATTGIDPPAGVSNNRSYGSGAYPVGPDRSHGGYNYTRAAVREAAFALRGHLPGVLVPLHARPHAEGSVVPFIEGIGLGQWLVVNYNVVEPDVADRNGQVLFRLDAPWR